MSTEWQLTDTPIAGRKNLFDMTEGSERHIGTLVSGSQKHLKLFEKDADLIGAAPDLYKTLMEAREAVAELAPDNEPAADLLVRIDLALAKADGI